jgi:hypothetical protein
MESLLQLRSRGFHDGTDLLNNEMKKCKMHGKKKQARGKKKKKQKHTKKCVLCLFLLLW